MDNISLEDFKEDYIAIGAKTLVMSILIHKLTEEGLVDKLQDVIDSDTVRTRALFEKVEQELVSYEEYELANVIKTFINYNF